jgi:hypothetical protein
MNTLNTVPGFTAEASLYKTSGQYHMSQANTAAPHLVVPQLRCPCPQGLLTKAARLCRNPAEGGSWCDLLDRCLDCFDV